MSTTLAFRLILGLLVGGVLTCSVWDRSYTELEERPTDDDTRTGMPRFRSFAAVETLPTMLVMYLVISFAIGGREMAVQYLLGLLLRVFLLIGVYYVLLLAVMPLLRRHISARVCAVLWLLPGYLYFLAQVSSVQRADPGGERMLVLHASGTLVTVLLAVWAAGAIGVFAWKIISHLRFRRRVLKDAVVVTDEQMLAVWQAELARAWLGETKWTLVRAPQLTTPLSIGLFQKTTCVALPARSYTPEELSQIVTRSAGILGIPCEAEGAMELARRSRGTPRIANRFLKRVRDFAQVQGSGVITPEIAAEALERLEVDYLGLDRIDRRILSTIIQNYAGGPVGLDTLAAAVGEESVTLEDVYEPYLMQIGFLTRTPRGRCVTRLAYNHLHLEAPDGVPDAQMTLQC